jgi:AcrR family transcriptional regulator
MLHLMQNPASAHVDGRELRSMRTRQRIRQAAVDLFERRGVEAVTVDEIADVAGVSRRTFFHHFATKEDAALLPIDRGTRLLGEGVETARAQPVFRDAVIDLTLSALSAVATATPDATELAWRSARLAGRELRLHQRVAELMLVWEQILEDALDGVDLDIDPLERRITIAAIVAATRVALLWSAVNRSADQLLPTVAAALQSLRAAGVRRGTGVRRR